MNRLLLVINIVLLVAVAYLYYAFYSKPTSPQIVKKTSDTSLTHIKLAYFDMDTLEKYYAYAKETRDYLSSRKDGMDAKLDKIKSDYTSKVNDYQKRGASMSQTEQTQMQEDLARLQNTYDQQYQSLNQQFQGEYMQKMLDLKNKIQDFLKTYSTQKGFAYVFATSSDDNVIYFKDSLRDITNDIVAKLNEDFKNSKKK
ncbi:MAG TPA: OmpH family outer membrane protein [Parafilimonas sp.]|nr:OmpH family outer membrane protein [Parafilimonas sp.]